MASTQHFSSEYSKPIILSVCIPDIKKRRVPNKFYTYKIVVEWSNGQKVTVYRRYSNFFDFWCKLKELHSNLMLKSYNFQKKSVSLPDMPGKIYIGRSQIHQVAEKRQKRLEEFCQQLIKMPSEISQSTILYGFFSLWPDDTVSGIEVRRQSTSGRSKDNIIRPDLTSSVQMGKRIVNPLLSNRFQHTTQVTSSESTEQMLKERAQTFDLADLDDDHEESQLVYMVTQDYNKLDSQQVDLKTGETVTVIEKHDTGWWMVEVEDIQGYAPASVLEAVNERGRANSAEDTMAEPDEYFVVEEFKASNSDEIDLNPGDLVEVIAIKMDGWWKIRKGDTEVYAPSAILRKKGLAETYKTLTRESRIFLYDRTLTRMSGRYPPRMSSVGNKISLENQIIKEMSPPQSEMSPLITLSHLPPGIEQRYEMQSSDNYLPDEYTEIQEKWLALDPKSLIDQGIYQAPKTLESNFNTSNNSTGDNTTGPDGPPHFDIYRSDTLTGDSTPSETPKSENTETVNDADTIYFDHLQKMDTLSKISRNPTADPEIMIPLEGGEGTSPQLRVSPPKLEKKLTPPPRIPRFQEAVTHSGSVSNNVSTPGQSNSSKQKEQNTSTPLDMAHLAPTGRPTPIPRGQTVSGSHPKRAPVPPPPYAKTHKAKQNIPVPSPAGAPALPFRQPVNSFVSQSGEGRYVEAPTKHPSVKESRLSPTPEDPQSEPKARSFTVSTFAHRPLPAIPPSRPPPQKPSENEYKPPIKNRPLPKLPSASHSKLMKTPSPERSSERTATPENQRYPLDYDEEYTPMNSVMYRKQSASDEYIDIDETADAERIPEISESDHEKKGQAGKDNSPISSALDISKHPSIEPEGEPEVHLQENIASKNVADLDQVPESSSESKDDPSDDNVTPSPKEEIDFSSPLLPIIQTNPNLVDYLNVTPDMKNGLFEEDDLYMNQLAAREDTNLEYQNVNYRPPVKLDHLGTYIATDEFKKSESGHIAVKKEDFGYLLAESKEWWYIRIASEEGWTPKEIWSPTKETMQLSEAISQRLSKKGSFAAADGIKPRAPPPKPRRTFEKLPETAQESIKMPPESASPHKPSVTVTSPAHQGSKTPPITYPLIQNRPLPSVPQVDGDSPYVCDITLNLSDQPWFYKTMDRPEAERLLKQPQVRNREFLVRERINKPGYYALSVRHHYSVRHFNIDPNPDNTFTIGQRTFKTIPSIILHYQTHSLFNESGPKEIPVTILGPAKCNSKQPIARYRSSTTVQ